MCILSILGLLLAPHSLCHTYLQGIAANKKEVSIPCIFAGSQKVKLKKRDTGYS
jgi:hypothetical protein